MRNNLTMIILVAAATVGSGSGCSSSAPGPSCPMGTAPASCVSFGPTATEDAIQTAFATAHDGTVFMFSAATYTFHNQLVIANNGVSVIGAGIDQTIFDFKSQATGDDGVFAQSVMNITLQDFTVRDTPGNAIKVLGGTGVTFERIKTLWTADDPSTHGGYGLYPVQSKNILVDHCVATGGSDSGIYLGQSDHAVIRFNEAAFNVAGIEVENTFFADVHDNNVHDNAGGILVFDLPGLQQLGGHDVHVYNNQITGNNTPNFAAQGNTVGIVPHGTGFLVMANKNVEFDHNTVSDNETGNSAVISYYATNLTIMDPNYYPLPSNVWIHDNTFSGGGNLPDLSRQFGFLLSTALSVFPNMTVPSLMWDGIVDAMVTTNPNNPMQICYSNNGSATFVNIHLDQFDSNNPNLPTIQTQDITNNTCMLTPLAPVTFPGLTP